MKQWKGYVKGVNLGGWFSQCMPSETHYDSFITEDDFKVIAGWGCDHVRVPVDFILLEDQNGVPRERGMERLENCVSLCRKYSLNMIIDLHCAYGYSFGAGGELFTDPALQERFYTLWERIAARFGRDADMLAFELLNEVTDPAIMSNWCDIALKCIARIRVFAPDTMVLIGGHSYNSVVAVRELPPPPDENIVYNFHDYDPKAFTHQGAHWMPRLADFSMAYTSDMAKMLELSEAAMPGSTSEYNWIKTDSCGAEMYLILFEDAVKYAEEQGVPLYCGEYGVIDRATPEDTLKWYKEIHRAFDALGIGRAAWTYRKMDFGLSDLRMKPVIDELVNYL